MDDAEPDALLDTYLAAARQFAEHYTGRMLMPQTWEMAVTSWADVIEIPAGPVASITSVKYYSAAGVDSTVNSSLYTLDNYGLIPCVRLARGAAWPGTDGRENGIRIRFVAGYTDAASVPAGIRHWIMLRAAEAVRHREETVDGAVMALPWIDALLDPFRVRWGV